MPNVRLVGSDGEPRSRFLAGEPFGLEIELSGAAEASSLHLELRDGSGLLVAEEILDPRALGGNGADGLSLRFDVARRRSSSAGSTSASRSSATTGGSWTGSRAAFPCSSTPTARGAGSSASKERGGTTRRMQADELQDLPGLAHPDGARARLQFKHMTVREAQLPFEIVGKIPESLSLDEVEICCDVDHHVVNAAHTHPDVVAALAGTHWFEVQEWSSSGPGADSGAAPHAA